MHAMHALVINNLAALTIAVIYYAWRDLFHARRLKEQQLRDRVTYMLWVMANEVV